ncbi:hypothetical protein [Natronorubrum aibiense]|uniref:Uncharacterized protein n=1 Tax=Natronorubrum aibiense TaxID=348826 RepID=A0A5P9P9G5_9EURY|nr:hypothetical protein [Natronorubrum aibiense]QFU84789.1 hypothetical protein GCU68_19990 [Natronorubrum aibiense]
MLRAVIGVLGILAVLVPDRILEIFEAAAIENPNECATKPWIRSGIRAEGIVVTIASLVGGRTYARMMDLTGVFGAVILLFPQLYRRFAINLLYEHPDEVEWNHQFTDGVRIIGALYVFFAVRAFTKRRANKSVTHD